MWLLFGAKTKARPVADGLTVDRHCPECNQTRLFLECDVTDKIDLFFVKVGEATQRRLVCSECGHDEAPPPSSPKPPPPAKPKLTMSEGDKDKLLADLKRRMGK
jgi:hypothetical protein